MSKKVISILSAFTALSLVAVCHAAPTGENEKSSPTKTGPKPPPNTNPNNPSKTAPASRPFEAFTGKVNGSKVRLRTQPDLDGKVLKELNKGDLLIIVGENNGYYAVKPPKGTKAYVFRSYVLDNVVEVARVNVRLEPSLEGPVIGYLKAGDRVEGTISSANNKWLEIEPPSTAKFYVAKEYVQSMGSPEVFESTQRRKNEADDLLNNAYTLSQSELRKPFNQINLEGIYQQFNKIIKDYPDFPEQVAKAKEAMDIVQKTYLQKQIAFLESKTQQTEESLQAKQASINAEIEGYQKKLADLEDQLKKEREASSSLLATVETSQPSKSEPSVPVNPSADQPKPSNKDKAVEGPTPQMSYWVPIEDDFYKKWLRSNPPGSRDDFYKAEQYKSVTLTGVIEPFSHTMKNRPGDYVLKVNHLPVAYLYSTRIDLNQHLGRTVKVVAIPRANNHFAYPAYFVLSVE
jgi:hypothetical protein